MRTISLAEAARIIVERAAGARRLTAIVGPPAAGKSTAAEALVIALNLRQPGSAAVIPMDGFHYDDKVLLERGLRHKKGAPETFDVGGFFALLSRLKANDEEEIAIPVFDRDLEIARAGGRIVGRAARHIVVEGNYLLLDRSPWLGLAALFDTTIAIVANLDQIRERLENRWTAYGLLKDEVVRKIEENDLPNARLVLAASAEPQFWLAGDFDALALTNHARL
jgi:pantothenate kinase